jgi:hypothetical protein
MTNTSCQQSNPSRNAIQLKFTGTLYDDFIKFLLDVARRDTYLLGMQGNVFEHLRTSIQIWLLSEFT